MTIDKIFERYAGWGGFITVLVIMYFVPIDYYNFIGIINATPEVSISIFGILLAFMGIILQGQNDTIKSMLDNEKKYGTFMFYGNRVELNSALLTIYSLIVTNVHLSLIIPESLSIYMSNIKQVAIALYWAMITKLFIDLYYYIRIFNLLFKKNG